MNLLAMAVIPLPIVEYKSVNMKENFVFKNNPSRLDYQKKHNLIDMITRKIESQLNVAIYFRNWDNLFL